MILICLHVVSVMEGDGDYMKCLGNVIKILCCLETKIKSKQQETEDHKKFKMIIENNCLLLLVLLNNFLLVIECYGFLVYPGFGLNYIICCFCFSRTEATVVVYICFFTMIFFLTWFQINTSAEDTKTL
ncbi:hypothetical protein ACJX0J_008628, partial [Zea mays]